MKIPTTLLAAALWFSPQSIAQNRLDRTNADAGSTTHRSVSPRADGFGALEQAFDKIIPPALDAEKIPGAVIAIGLKAESGFRIWRKAYGFMQLEPRRVPMREDAIFDLASLTKPVATGTSIMILAERGKLSINDPVSKFLPEFQRESKRGILIRHLMTHTSGLPPYLDETKQGEIREHAAGSCCNATRAAVRSIEPTGVAGNKVVYSCLNAILCAEIVEKFTGQSIDRFTRDNVFVPLRMSDTGFTPGLSLLPRLAPTTRSSAGRAEGGFLAGQVHDPLAAMQDGVSGNAGLFSTAADLSRFAQMMLNGGELNGVRILSDSSVREMTATQNAGAVNAAGEPDQRGLLWDIYPAHSEAGVDMPRAFGHTGFTGTAIRVYPEAGIYVIALTNRVHPQEHGGIEEFRKAVFRTALQTLMPPHP